MIRDTAGNEITYWPINLQAGEYSDILTIRLDVPREAVLWATASESVTFFGRPVGPGEFVNLSEVGLPLDGYVGPWQDFQVYAYANEGTAGLPRVPLVVGSMGSGPAGWAA
jgi:hypothetical protein